MQRQIPNFYRNFTYDSKAKKITAYGVSPNSNAQDLIDDLRNLRPSEITDKDFRGFIRFLDDKYTKEQCQKADQGKWLLRFPSGSTDLDIAWTKLVDCVAKGELDEIKVYPQATSGDFVGQQTIAIYNFHIQDTNAIVYVYDKLKELGLIDLHLKQEMNNGIIEYKADQQTLASQYGKDAHMYTNQDIGKLRKQVPLSATHITSPTFVGENKPAPSNETNKLQAAILQAIDKKLMELISEFDKSGNSNFNSKILTTNIDQNANLTTEQKDTLKIIDSLKQSRKMIAASDQESAPVILENCKKIIAQQITAPKKSIWSKNKPEIFKFLDQLILEIGQKLAPRKTI